jgi:hypothetical protein
MALANIPTVDKMTQSLQTAVSSLDTQKPPTPTQLGLFVLGMTRMLVAKLGLGDPIPPLPPQPPRPSPPAGMPKVPQPPISKQGLKLPF